MITLSEQNMQELNAFINKIPTEFGLPLLQFFGKLQHDQQSPSEAPVVDLKKED